MQQLILVTDFNTSDPYLGYLKSEIYHRCPNIRIIDLAHNIPYSDISLAAYFMKGYHILNRTGNIILIAVNNFYCKTPEYICFEYNDNIYIGPDNGLFSLIIENLESQPIHKINNDELGNSLENIYSHAIGCIHHKLPIDELGPVMNNPDMKILFRPVVTSNNIRATIIHVDIFKNIITNLTKDTFEKARTGRNFKIFYDPRNPITKISNHFGEVEIGEVACIFNSSGHLEIGVNQGKASTLLHLYKNETIQIDFTD